MQISEPVYLHYMSSLLEGDKKTCHQIISNLLDNGTDTKDIYKGIIQKSMYRIGELWDKCRISIASEHIASEITKEVLSLINIKRGTAGFAKRSAILTCVQKEQHDIGPRIISNYLEIKGWDSKFIGTNIPDKELLKYISDHKPDLVGISNNFYLNVTKLLDVVELIKNNFPGQRIMIGGQGPDNCHLQSISKFPEITYLKNLDELDNYLVELENRN